MCVLINCLGIKEMENTAGWVGTAFGVLGAILVACNIGWNDVGYIFFLVGSIFSLYTSIAKRDNSGIVLWSVFAFINVIGIISYFK